MIKSWYEKIRNLGKKQEIKETIQQVDRERKGIIEFWRFYELMMRKIIERYLKVQILKVFKLFDYDRTGKICFKNSTRVTKQLQQTMNNDQLNQIIDEDHKDQDYQINEQEFIGIMRKINVF